MKSNYFKLILILVIIFGIGLLFLFKYRENSSLKTILINQIPFHVFIANTQMSQEQGLSGKSSLSANEGMLFIFNRPDLYGFWMKDMNFSLDFLWISPDLTINSITTDVPPSSYPSIYYPSSPVLYVLEVPAGTADKYLLKVGEHISLNP